MMTLLERTDLVLGRGRRDFGSVCFLLVGRRMPLGDGVKDDLGRERRHLSKLRITNHLSLNSLPLRLQMVFYLLQLSTKLLPPPAAGRGRGIGVGVSACLQY